jgi:hypothetical protein
MSTSDRHQERKKVALMSSSELHLNIISKILCILPCVELFHIKSTQSTTTKQLQSPSAAQKPPNSTCNSYTVRTTPYSRRSNDPSLTCQLFRNYPLLIQTHPTQTSPADPPKTASCLTHDDQPTRIPSAFPPLYNFLSSPPKVNFSIIFK